jgi:eukaryotic-like serine/threonine-protein kinase
MFETTRKPTSDPDTIALYAVASKLDALSKAWQGDDLPPRLAEFLDEVPAANRVLVLTELIKVDLEYRWQEHELPKQVEEYVEEFPELAAAGGVPCDLIYEEFHVRRNTGNPPSPENYFARFPEQTERLRRMMTIEPDRISSTILLARPREAELDVGQQIDDFDLLVRLGKGSFGSVFLARQISMQRLVALKITRDRGVEPQTLAQLDHPHIVRVYDQRQLPERRLQLMYMQHVPGGTLQDVLETIKEQSPAERSGKSLLKSVDRALEEHGQSPVESSTRQKLTAFTWPEAVCWLGARLAEALDYAHGRGVLHRDVKPANVLLAADGTPKLVDFNVSFASKLEGATPAAYFGGSLVYMSPEQIEAYNPDHSRKPDELDGRCDIYSLGLVLWELLTGERPFGDERMEATQFETLKKLTERRRRGIPEKALAAVPPTVPTEVRDTLLAALAPDAEDRPATAKHLARRLDLCLQPRVQDLIHPPPGSNRHWLRRRPLSFFIPLGLLPSVVLSLFNLPFNAKEIIGKEGIPDEVKNFFNNVQVPVINGVTFSIAIFLVVRFSWPVLTALRHAARHENVAPDELQRARRRALWIGDYAAWLGMGLWIVTGLTFPTWLYLQFGSIKGAGIHEFESFLASQIACGGISSTITFFLINLLMVRVYYPVLLRNDLGDGAEGKQLLRLERRSSICFYLTVTASFVTPILALALIISSISGDLVKAWMGILSVIGFVSCFASFKLLQVIRYDLEALAVAIDPAHASKNA